MINFQNSYIENKSKYIKFTNLKLLQGGTNGDDLNHKMENIFNDIHLVHAVNEYNPENYRFTISNNMFQIDELVKGSAEYEIGASTSNLSSNSSSKIKTKEICSYDQPLTDELMEKLIDYKSSYRGYIHCSWGSLVHSHKGGSWDRAQMIISSRLALQKGRIVVATPLDTMILDYLSYDDKSFLLCDIDTLKQLNTNKVLPGTNPIAKIFVKDKLHYEKIEGNDQSEDLLYHGLVNGIHLYTFDSKKQPDLRNYIAKIILSRHRMNILSYKTRFGRELIHELDASSIHKLVKSFIDDNFSDHGYIKVVKNKLITNRMIGTVNSPTMYVQDILSYDKLQKYLESMNIRIACANGLFQEIKPIEFLKFFDFVYKLYNTPKMNIIEKNNETKILLDQLEKIQETKTNVIDADITNIIEKLKVNLDVLYDTKKYTYLKEWAKIIEYIAIKENDKWDKMIAEDFMKKKIVLKANTLFIMKLMV